MSKIKFGTDGWRAIIAKDYTVENVARVSMGTAHWLKQNFEDPTVVIGHDCRYAGEMFAETAAKVLYSMDIKVRLAKGPVSTPMVSLGTLKTSSSLGIVITASHNPPTYNGFKLKGHFGGPLLPAEVQAVEDLIPETNEIDLEAINIEELTENGAIEYVDLESMYFDHVEENFDMASIRDSKMQFAFDAMYGAGQDIMRRLMPDLTFLHAEHNPGFNGTAPEPIHRNLQEFSDTIKLSDGEIDCGLAVDGDADRIGLYNSKGEFVDSHHIILLLIKYLVEQKNFSGKVILAFSVSPKVKKLCEKLGLEVEIVKIGFKHIAGFMVTEDVLLGGEESGGIAIKGHIPERDGIWMGLTIWEYMVKSGKSLEVLIQEVYDLIGSFKFERIDLHIDESKKVQIMQNCADDAYKAFGSYEVKNIETIDGYKYYFDNEEWVMIRPSGTEPVLRTYAESSTTEGAFKILKEVHETIQS